jgi:hypothetical protein
VKLKRLNVDMAIAIPKVSRLPILPAMRFQIDNDNMAEEKYSSK